MPSNKKTRKQKILSDSRRSQVTLSSSATYSLASMRSHTPTSHKPLGAHQPSDILTQNYQYLSHDLRKTLGLTIAIILIQIVLHAFVIK